MGCISFGEMYKGQHLQSRLDVSVTIINKHVIFNSLHNEDRLKNMMDIMQNQVHANILASYEFLHDRKNFYIITADAKGHNLGCLLK